MKVYNVPFLPTLWRRWHSHNYSHKSQVPVSYGHSTRFTDPSTPGWALETDFISSWIRAVHPCSSSRDLWPNLCSQILNGLHCDRRKALRPRMFVIQVLLNVLDHTCNLQTCGYRQAYKIRLWSKPGLIPRHRFEHLWVHSHLYPANFITN